MPGVNLSTAEKSLQKKWDAPSYKANYLRSIQIKPLDAEAKVTGIRGIQDITVEFNYPVSVIVGPNGCGKSTILNIAALSYKGLRFTPTSRTSPGYRFPDFFCSTRNEDQPQNFSITWKYVTKSNQDKQTVMQRKSTSRWMRYERRHDAEVIHLGLSRISSWSESPSHKRAFISEKSPQATVHSDWVSSSMSKIFSREYSNSSSLAAGKFVVPQLQRHSGNRYSGFNMGTGEAATLSILSEISNCPKGTLVLIEEIEMAIHPSAQAKFAQVLIDRALEEDLQIICTSHSRWFIDALPRQARLLIQVNGDSHTCIPNVTTRFAESSLAGKFQSELLVICEDPVGAALVEASLPMVTKNRIDIVACGSKHELSIAAAYARRANENIPILIVWDGDATNAEIRDASSRANGGKGLDGAPRIEWTRIGPPQIMESNYVHSKTDAPEIVIKDGILADYKAVARVAGMLGGEATDVREIIQSAAIGVGDHHNLSYDIGQRTGHASEYITQILAKCYVESVQRSVKADLPVTTSINSILEHGCGQFISPGGIDEGSTKIG
ncbi:putative ATPase [Arthrobacter stackebrandtii]|uniref:ATPase n=1 Tax=Arthrobacter stackebrandtii TaxID=272161 RepID=A0ABS4YSJ2_9MICC|nr:AAA family ATPase [Arthrobacter stackebrandtii]MBP2411745.1 putative ATPase [Arthrobacter stackebrandtii]PYG99142.1 hypothetical protein CVV67_16425 [Arthrobacter stackebrandtii]